MSLVATQRPHGHWWGRPADRELPNPAPEPSRSVALMRFALPRPIYGLVAVHDAQDRVIRNLSCGELAAGEHSLAWDGRDESSAPVHPGDYTIQLWIGEERIVSRRVSIT